MGFTVSHDTSIRQRHTERLLQYVAQAIRFAQSMGLHRAPGPAWDLSKFEVVVRQRIWWSLVCIDKMHSLSYGRPYSIFAAHCDTPLPDNIDADDLTADGPRNIRPECEVTTMSRRLLAEVAARMPLRHGYSCFDSHVQVLQDRRRGNRQSLFLCAAQ